jgi:hypothetical protein
MNYCIRNYDTNCAVGDSEERGNTIASEIYRVLEYSFLTNDVCDQLIPGLKLWDAKKQHTSTYTHQ